MILCEESESSLGWSHWLGFAFRSRSVDETRRRAEFSRLLLPSTSSPCPALPLQQHYPPRPQSVSSDGQVDISVLGVRRHASSLVAFAQLLRPSPTVYGRTHRHRPSTSAAPPPPLPFTSSFSASFLSDDPVWSLARARLGLRSVGWQGQARLSTTASARSSPLGQQEVSLQQDLDDKRPTPSSTPAYSTLP